MSEKYIEDRIDNLEAYCEDLFGRVAKLETGAVCDTVLIEDHTKHIGTLQTAQIKGFSELNRLSARVDELSIRFKVDQATAGYRVACTAAANPKIKGGWLNLYHTSPGKTLRAGALFSTRGEADAATVGNDHRVACIHITDFTEGEGL